MSHLEIDSAPASLGKHFGEPLPLSIIEGVLGLVATGQMRHDAPDPDRITGSCPREGIEYIRVLSRADAVAVQAGVDLDRDLRSAAGTRHRGKEILDLM